MMKSQSQRKALINGLIAAFLHLYLLTFIIWGILTSTDVAAWPMIWMVMIFVDMPIMLVQWILPFDLLHQLLEPMVASSPLAGTRIGHLNSFIMPALSFGILGTSYWFLLGFGVTKWRHR